MSQEKLFSEFSAVSTEAWEELINKDLKGADYNRKLVWHTIEGFDVLPYYRAENLQNLDYLNTLPNEFPYTRGVRKAYNQWQIVQEINVTQPEEANRIATDALAKGATVVAFNAKDINSIESINKLLCNIDLEKYGVQFSHAPDYPALAGWITQHVETKGYDKAKITGGINFDPVMSYLKNGKFFRSQNEDMQQTVQLVQLTQAMTQFKTFNINGLIMHNAGATIVQELGYALAVGREYLTFLTENGLAIDIAASKMSMTLSVGSNYFMEIAKLRAVRLLWATLVEAYQPNCPCAGKLHINSVASSWNKTLYDPYVNMLRSTTEGMAAAIGGADSIALKPFDLAYKTDNDFSCRISRNVQVILKEESYFDKVADPAAGSYYIENLTDSLVEHAWKLFQNVENEGGMIAAINKGTVKADIEKSCQQRDMDIATRKYILLGTNQYPNLTETMLDKIETEENNDSQNLKSYRGAYAFEAVRVATERYAQQHDRPKVFLLKIGNLAMRQARAGFVTNFFGCAGYEIIETSGYNTVEEGVKDALDAKAAIIAVCSSDEEYATLGMAVAQQIKAINPNMIVIIAGNPVESMEALKVVGVTDFIHVKTNVLDTLRTYNAKLLK
ncbi:MAG: methylmalonyl-CoA mutase subunit beta [Bacteroidales bacterium]|jgi:methylmalonyl-CoA mutase|nr:methylmalonyl-CoA mutase subunit beta [Bacteroidales bacterium]